MDEIETKAEGEGVFNEETTKITDITHSRATVHMVLCSMEDRREG